MNRKVILGVATIISSLAIVLHAFSYESWHLYVLSYIVGFFQGMVSALPYMLPSLYFKE
jgi:sugar phosphate permease